MKVVLLTIWLMSDILIGCFAAFPVNSDETVSKRIGTLPARSVIPWPASAESAGSGSNSAGWSMPAAWMPLDERGDHVRLEWSQPLDEPKLTTFFGHSSDTVKTLVQHTDPTPQSGLIQHLQPALLHQSDAALLSDKDNHVRHEWSQPLDEPKLTTFIGHSSDTVKTLTNVLHTDPTLQSGLIQLQQPVSLHQSDTVLLSNAVLQSDTGHQNIPSQHYLYHGQQNELPDGIWIDQSEHHSNVLQHHFDNHLTQSQSGPSPAVLDPIQQSPWWWRWWSGATLDESGPAAPSTFHGPERWVDSHWQQQQQQSVVLLDGTVAESDEEELGERADAKDEVTSAAPDEETTTNESSGLSEEDKVAIAWNGLDTVIIVWGFLLTLVIILLDLYAQAAIDAGLARSALGIGRSNYNRNSEWKSSSLAFKLSVLHDILNKFDKEDAEASLNHLACQLRMHRTLLGLKPITMAIALEYLIDILPHWISGRTITMDQLREYDKSLFSRGELENCTES